MRNVKYYLEGTIQIYHNPDIYKQTPVNYKGYRDNCVVIEGLAKAYR